MLGSRRRQAIGSFNQTLLDEIQEIQTLVKGHYELFPGVGETAPQYLTTLREQWELTDAPSVPASASAGLPQ